jgi:hypothetical protein
VWVGVGVGEGADKERMGDEMAPRANGYDESFEGKRDRCVVNLSCGARYKGPSLRVTAGSSGGGTDEKRFAEARSHVERDGSHAAASAAHEIALP